MRRRSETRAVWAALLGAGIGVAVGYGLGRPRSAQHVRRRARSGAAGRGWRRRAQTLEAVSDDVLADRVRSSIGALEKRLDVPRSHVMVEHGVVLLHGDVPRRRDAHRLERAVCAVPGVRGVRSCLHVGLLPGDTRPSAGHAEVHHSPLLRQLLEAAAEAGVAPKDTEAVVHGVLATFAERLPAGTRRHLAGHLPADVRVLFEPPRRRGGSVLERHLPAFVTRVTAASEGVLPADRAEDAVRAVLTTLQRAVPEEGADVAAVLPEDLRDLWLATPAGDGPALPRRHAG